MSISRALKALGNPMLRAIYFSKEEGVLIEEPFLGYGYSYS